VKLGIFYRDYNGKSGMPVEIQNLAVGLSKLGISTNAFCYGNANLEHQSNGVKVNQYLRPRFFLNLPRALVNDVINGDFDYFLVIGGHIKENFQVCRMLGEINIKYMYCPGNPYNPVLMNKSPILKSVWKVCFELQNLNNSAIVRSYSQFNTQCIRSYGYKGEVVELYEGIDTADVMECSTLEISQEGKSGKHFIYVGRIDIFGKGLDQLLIAFSKFRARHTDYNLTVIGPFQSKTDESLFFKLAALSNGGVEYYPTVYGKQKFKFMRDADLFIYPSRFEGIPRSIREALFVGTPVLVTQATNFADNVVKYRAGLVCELTIESIEAALGEFQSKPKDFFNGNPEKLIAEKYNWESVCLNYKSIIEAQLQNHLT